MSPEDVDALELRVANGIRWLDEHDPVGRFHAWWQAGLTPISPLPAHEATPEVREQWADYYRRRTLWEQLYRRLENAEGKGLTRPPAFGWQGQGVRP